VPVGIPKNAVLDFILIRKLVSKYNHNFSLVPDRNMEFQVDLIKPTLILHRLLALQYVVIILKLFKFIIQQYYTI